MEQYEHDDISPAVVLGEVPLYKKQRANAKQLKPSVFRVRRRSHLHLELFGSQLGVEIKGVFPVILAEFRQALGGAKITYDDTPRDHYVQLALQKQQWCS